MSRYIAEDQEQMPRSTLQQTSQLLSTSQAAAYLGLSVNTVRKYLADGRISAYRVGKRLIKFDTADLDRFLQKMSNDE